jgi:hypothetical protein
VPALFDLGCSAADKAQKLGRRSLNYIQAQRRQSQQKKVEKLMFAKTDDTASQSTEAPASVATPRSVSERDEGECTDEQAQAIGFGHLQCSFPIAEEVADDDKRRASV